MNAHPAAGLFPLMVGDELEALAADIQTHGLAVPIVLHQGLVLDGRNRLAACELAGVEPSFVEWGGTGDPTAWVVSQNLHRRHLSESQRAMVAARLAGLPAHRPEGTAQICALTQPKAAELLNVGKRSVQSARTVQEHGIPELATAVDADEVSVFKAAQIARLPEPEQPAAIEEARRPHVANNSGYYEWYTPSEYAEAARSVLGTIDLDPASSETANATVGAVRYYSAIDSGLDHEWTGKVWMNPPYSRGVIEPFCAKLAKHVASGEVPEAIVIVNNGTETGWFEELWKIASAVVFPTKRVKFWRPEGQIGGPLQGQAVLYCGHNVDKFLATFMAFGLGAEVRHEVR